MNRSKKIAYLFLGVILLTIVIELISIVIKNEYVFPNVYEILKKFFLLFLDKKLYLSTLNTIFHLLLAVVFSLIIGGAFAIISSFNERIYLLLKPINTILRSLPIIVLILITLIIFDFSSSAVVASTLALIPLFYEAFYQGIISIDKVYLDVYKLESAFNLKILFKVYIPLIASYCKVSLINALGMGIKILITTEYLSGVKNTIGECINSSWASFDYTAIYAYSLYMVILVLVLEGCIPLIIALKSIIFPNKYETKQK